MENFYHENWHELEAHCFDSCHSSNDASSDNYESDKEAMEVEESNTSNIRKAAEEAGFEGLRILLGSQGLEMKEQERSDVERLERSMDRVKPVETSNDGGRVLKEWWVRKKDGMTSEEGDKIERMED